VGAPGKYLSVYGTKPTSGQDVHTRDNPNDPATQWYIFQMGNNEHCIANVYTKECINVSRHDKFNGARVFTWDNPDKQLSKFKINQVGEFEVYTIESCYTPKHILNVEGNQNKNGAPIILWDDYGNWSSQWKITKVGGGKFNPNEWAQPHIHAFLDSHGLQEMPDWLRKDLPNQRIYTLESKQAPGKFLSSHGVLTSGYHEREGANLVLSDNPASPESQWYLMGAGFYPHPDPGSPEMERHILVNVGSQKTLAVSRHDKRTGGPVLLSLYPFSQETIFQVQKKSDAFIIQSIYNPTQHIYAGWQPLNNGTKCRTHDNTWESSTQWNIKQIAGPTGPMFPLGGSRL